MDENPWTKNPRYEPAWLDLRALIASAEHWLAKNSLLRQKYRIIAKDCRTDSGMTASMVRMSPNSANFRIMWLTGDYGRETVLDENNDEVTGIFVAAINVMYAEGYHGYVLITPLDRMPYAVWEQFEENQLADVGIRLHQIIRQYRWPNKAPWFRKFKKRLRWKYITIRKFIGVPLSVWDQ